MIDENAFRNKIRKLEKLARLCRGDIVKMTTVAGSGHPAGSLSSIDIYLALFTIANIDKDSYDDPRRDRIIVSHGHTSPGLYSCLARLGFFSVDQLLPNFRQMNGPFEGHVERTVPGIEWSTGNLGQGLSAGCGFALGSKLRGFNYHTYVVMSDAEQAKGQVAEARRFAHKFALANLTVVIDRNHFQISGRTEEVMPVDIKNNYEADGWKVLQVSGHDFMELYRALSIAVHDNDCPYLIIAETHMGHGIAFMEDRAAYHGKAATQEECAQALAALGLENDIEVLRTKRERRESISIERSPIPVPSIKTGTPRVYTTTTHPRVAFGNALADIAALNPEGFIAVFDCDLADSVQVGGFAKVRPKYFFECGVSEHNTATIAGALSINGVVSVWADFGVFAIDEVYNQLRLNSINKTNMKVVATHLGYNVGPDGKTHHCIDYIGLLKNLFDFHLIIPSDPNQTDHMTRYFLKKPGNYVLGIARTKLPILQKEDGTPLYDDNYVFTYGKIDLVRDGEKCALFTYGPMVHEALKAWGYLRKEGIGVRIYNISSPLAIDREIIAEAAETNLIITYEDHISATGLGNTVAHAIAEDNLDTKLVTVGIDRFGGSDASEVLYRASHLDADWLVEVAKKAIGQKGE